LGGSISYIRRGEPGFFEKNNTDRFTTQAALAHRFGENLALNLKNSFTRFQRDLSLPAHFFGGLQQASFSEVNLNYTRAQLQWIGGVNLVTDGFEEKRVTGNPDRTYHYTTVGGFVQNTWTATESFTLESGLRGDYTAPFGFVWLPRVSALFRLSPAWTARIGGGAGYKLPSIFNEEAERLFFRNINPVNQEGSVYERSVGGNVDVNYRARIGEVGLSINQLFFYTRLRHPFVLVPSAGAQGFENIDGAIQTKGAETNIRLTWSQFKLFIGYTFTDAETAYRGASAWLPLTARHRLNNVLMYEVEGSLKIGLEAYYFSPQQLNDGAMGQQYWIAGLMAEKLFRRFSVFVNFENFTDARQTKFDTIFRGPVNNPSFRDIYAPVEGFVVNGGFKIRL
jgi:iron complex outermembrane receptor protein